MAESSQNELLQLLPGGLSFSASPHLQLFGMNRFVLLCPFSSKVHEVSQASEEFITAFYSLSLLCRRLNS